MARKAVRVLITVHACEKVGHEPPFATAASWEAAARYFRGAAHIAHATPLGGGVEVYAAEFNVAECEMARNT